MFSFEIENRCKKLLRDSRIDIMMYQKEFYGIKKKLLDRKVTLEYLDYVEKHINNIDPHIQVLTVNGEDVPVQFTTRIKE